MNAILCGVGHNLRKILPRWRALLSLLSITAKTVLRELIDYLVTIRLQKTQFEPPDARKGFCRAD